MPQPQETPLTYTSIIADLMSKATGPLPVKEMIDQMLALLPTSARNPQSAMRKHIREAKGWQLVFLDADTVLPVCLAYQDVRFRIPLERDSFVRGWLPIGPVWFSYLPLHFPQEKIQLVDKSGQPIPTSIKQTTKKLPTLFGPVDTELYFFDLGRWYRSQEMYVKDQLLFTVLDWAQGIFQLEREPFSQRNPTLLAERNRLLADLFYDLLERSSSEDISVNEAVPTVYARLPDKDGYPPGNWLDVLEQDGRMRSEGFSITYRDRESPLSRLLNVETKKAAKPAASRPGKAEREQVYRFKAHLEHRPKIWREIEIQAGQTLADLDGVLRGAFNHDDWDHMGGFWRLIPRGAPAKAGTKKGGSRKGRYREVAIGDVEPGGGGDGAHVKLVDLGLSVGDQVKYVYNFGDWIEHILALEAIEAPQAKVKYPREVGRNKPEYALCVECEKKGKQKKAKWICLDCSNKLQQEVLLCDGCVEQHEDHYVEEILY